MIVLYPAALKLLVYSWSLSPEMFNF